jgi:hypothetical protein
MRQEETMQNRPRFAEPDEREHVGRRIDPETAHVFFVYAQTLDPYGDGPHLPPERQQVGREYFAIDPREGWRCCSMSCRRRLATPSNRRGAPPTPTVGRFC